ncbi:MAG TPA: MFS transporter [Candidatus Thermoplasmatota archaeon]|nr:MFS transporter [Candidatus Thermoplasmatota archaeon]
MAEGGVRQVLSRVVLVGALGYFVDIYDLLLFTIVRNQSLLDLGIAPGQGVTDVGGDLFMWQMAGLLLGGVLWGVLGDKRGRRSVLFGSIALYSLANLANAAVTSVPMYAALRFLAGLGLAGELGAAVTLVSEALPAHLRGYGTMLVSAVGILGAAAGFLVALVDWRIAYLVGGLGGLLLLALRIAMAESGMYERMARGGQRSRRGDLRMFVGSPSADGFHWFHGNGDRLGRLVRVFAVGVPLWGAIGILITFAPEVSRSLRVTGVETAATAVLVSYVGASLGSLGSGVVSQLLRSRRLAILLFLDFTILVSGAFLLLDGASTVAFYVLCGLLGFGVGYWAVFVQVAAEQFGTDLRATVATAAPNLVRGSVLLFIPAFKWLSPSLGAAAAGVLIMVVSLAGALVATWTLRETYGTDLDFTESSAATTIPQVSAVRQFA